jgi:hypothetical protein
MGTRTASASALCVPRGATAATCASASPNGDVWQVTEPAEGARNRLKSLDIKNPPTILDLA